MPRLKFSPDRGSLGPGNGLEAMSSGDDDGDGWEPASNCGFLINTLPSQQKSGPGRLNVGHEFFAGFLRGFYEGAGVCDEFVAI